VNSAEELIEGYDAGHVIADKGYDSQGFVKAVEGTGAAAVIPPRKNRVTPRAYDRHLYEERNAVERFVGRIKQFRRVATRYEKRARNFLAFVQLASIVVLLR